MATDSVTFGLRFTPNSHSHVLAYRDKGAGGLLLPLVVSLKINGKRNNLLT